MSQFDFYSKKSQSLVSRQKAKVNDANEKPYFNSGCL